MFGSLTAMRAHVLAVLVASAGAAIAIASIGCDKKPKGDPAEGKNLFVSACARCHGAAGDGGLPLFDGGPSPRNFCDHSFHASHTDEQIKLTIVNGKGTGMPPFGTTFTDAQLDALVSHVRAFDPEKNGK